MKLSFLLELLLILIIIAFAASMPVKEDRENVRKLKRISNAINVKQNIGLTSSTPVSIVSDDDDDDDDDDDLFDDLVDDDEDEDDSGVKKDPKGPGDQESEDSDDEDDLFGLADDEAEKDTPSDEEEEEFDGSELILFGEDIFQAVFDDDDEDTNKKKKPEILNNTINALVTAPPSTVPTVAPVKDQIPSTGHKDTELKPSNLNQKLANKTEILTEVNSNKHEKLTTLKPAVQLYLQHTPALLELAQSTLSHDASTAPAPNTDIKHEELQSPVTPSQQDTVSAIHPVQYSAQITEKPDLIYEENDEEKFDEAETNVDDDLGENEELIMVPDDKNENDKPIEEIKNPDEEEEELLEEDDKQPEEQKPDEEEIVKDPLPIADDSENIIPQNDKLTLGPGQIVSEQQQSEVAQQLISAQQTESIKKPNKEEDEGILGIVESIIFDEDEDESDSSKPIKTDTTTNNQDKNDETLEDEEEDEDEDDESEDDEDEDDDEKDEVQKPSVTTTTTTSTTSSPTPNEVNNTIKKKKKKQSSLLGALEESLGLSRIMQSEKIKKGKGKNKSKK